MNEIQALIESAKYPALSHSDASAMNVLLRNTAEEHAKMIAESNVTGDIAQFTPILMPLVRETFPKLVQNELLGVQPMSTPTGYMYALVSRLTGNGDVQDSRNGLVVVGFDEILDGAEAQADAGVTGVVAVEGKFALVERENFAGISGDIAGGASSIQMKSVAGDDVTANAIYSNRALMDRIFSKYTGPHATAAGEQLGRDMNEIGISVERKSIEAKTRALKARYTVEMFQDLKAQHDLAADEELISLISNEVRAEIDREIIGFVNTNATIAADTMMVAGDPAQAAGRWEVEKYRAQAVRISKEAALIGLQTRRAQGNTLLVSPLVGAMLQQVGTFTGAPMDSTIDKTAIGGVVGTFDNRFKVIVDPYAQEDYATVLYKGSDRRDAMGVFAPYVPIQFQRVTDYESGQPAIIAKTRYALDTMPDTHSAPSVGYDDPTRGSRYARTFGVDLTGTALA